MARLRVPDEELEEQFIRGWGHGGQKVNKTSSTVLLKHKPTGIVIKCKNSRSQVSNRSAARRILADKLDEIENGEQSRVARRAQREQKRKAKQRSRAAKKYGAHDDMAAGAGAGASAGAAAGLASGTVMTAAAGQDVRGDTGIHSVTQ